MRTIATVIARGGSKRLPRKNVLPFCGLPLVAWTIIQAKCSLLIDEVWLSTDDDEIQEVGEEYGAIVVRRPDWSDADTTSGMRPTRHLVQTIIDMTGEFDCHVNALPTEPLRVPNQLDRIVARFYAVKDINTRILEAIPMRETVLYEAVGDGMRLAIFDKSYQYLVSGFGTGAVNPTVFLQSTEGVEDADAVMDAETKSRAGEKRDPIVPYITLEVWQQVDVDTLPEFKLAEVLMEHYILQGRGRAVYDEYVTQFDTRRKQ